MTTSGKISKNIQFQNTHAGFTIFSVHSQHLKSSSSAFRPALSNVWLLLVLLLKRLAHYTEFLRLVVVSFGLDLHLQRGKKAYSLLHTRSNNWQQ